jgi:hypothetical protein
LSLDRVATLSPQEAKSLANHQGELDLGGLKTLSIEAAEALSRHEDWLHLEGLVVLSEDVVVELRANRKIRLPENFK